MRVTIVNAHWNNRGDEAAIRAVIDSLLFHFKDINITVVFKDSQEICQFPYGQNVQYVLSRFLMEEKEFNSALLNDSVENIDSEVVKVVNAITDANSVIYAPGGSVISDRFWWKKQLEYLFPIAYAEKLKIPVVFAAPSIGPFYEQYELRTEILKHVDMLCVREDISRKELEYLGITENVVTTIDSAFLNEIDTFENDIQLRKNHKLVKFLKKYKNVIGITISDFSWHVEYRNDATLKERIKETFTSFIRKLEKLNVGVLLIPQLFGNQNDRRYLQIYQLGNTYLLEDNYDAYFQQYIISKLYAVIGMRYHSNIFAAKMGVPFIPIIYEEKMRGFIQFIEWERYSEELYHLSFDNLYGKYLLLDKNYEILQQKLKHNSDSWRKRAEQTMNEIVKHIR